MSVFLVDFRPCLEMTVPEFCARDNSVRVYFGTIATPVGQSFAPAGWSFFPNPVTFSVPTVAPGTYLVTAIDAEGRSAIASFVVVAAEKTSQTITFASLSGKVYGDPDFPLSATASSGLPVTFSAAGPCSIVEGVYVRVLGTGECAITASQSGNDAFNAAADVRQAFNITRRRASVTPIAASKIYGNADPELGGTLEGFLASDGISASYSRSPGEAVGTYTISAQLSPVGALINYEVAYNTANFVIDPREASVTPNPSSKTYGDPDPAFTGVLVGFLTDDGIVATYTRTSGEDVGSYTISATLSPTSPLANYSVTYATATFTISITPESLCLLAKQYVGTSPKFLGLPANARSQLQPLMTSACEELVVSAGEGSNTAVNVAAFKRIVQALLYGGYLSPEQADVLQNGADHL